VPRLDLAAVADGEIGMNAVELDEHAHDRADPALHAHGPYSRHIVDQRLQNSPLITMTR